MSAMIHVTEPARVRSTPIIPTAGGSCQALEVNSGGVGNKTLLSIRPERVDIASDDAVNATRAKVLELIYLGDHIRCRMSVHGSDEFIVKVPNAAGHKHLVVGEETTISFAPEDCRALDA